MVWPAQLGDEPEAGLPLPSATGRTCPTTLIEPDELFVGRLRPDSQCSPARTECGSFPTPNKQRSRTAVCFGRLWSMNPGSGTNLFFNNLSSELASVRDVVFGALEK